MEVAGGSFDGALLAVRTSGLLGTASAKQVDAVERTYRFAGDTVHYDVAMAAVGIPLTHHLRAELRRT